jgi:hypothetical protein
VDSDAPFPGYKTLAKYMGCPMKMVQRHAQRLEAVGYLARGKRIGQTNLFHLTGLFQALEQHRARQRLAKGQAAVVRSP